MANDSPALVVVDPAGSNQANVKAASTAAAASDNALVAALSPNTPLPAGTNALGSVTANVGSTNGLALDSTQAVTQGAGATPGTAGSKSELVGGIYQSTPPTATAGQQVAVLVDANGRQVVNVNSLPSLPAGTNNIGSVTTSQPDQTATGALGALNATLTIPLAGYESVGFQLVAGTLIGTLVAEISFDGGTTWNPTIFDDPSTSNKTSTVVFSAANGAIAKTLVGVGGAGWYRVRVSAYTSGTANGTVRAAMVRDPSVLFTAQPGQAVPGDIAAVGGSDSGGLLRSLMTDTSGRLFVNAYITDSFKATYSSAVIFTPVGTTPTDVWSIYGSATKTVRILRIRFTATQTTAAVRDMVLIKRSTANTGGTSTAPAIVPHSAALSAATATVLAYTANPSALGTSLGNVRSRKMFVNVATTGNLDDTIWEFGNEPGMAIVLSGTTQGLCLSLNSVASSGMSLSLSCEWSEE